MGDEGGDRRSVFEMKPAVRVDACLYFKSLQRLPNVLFACLPWR